MNLHSLCMSEIWGIPFPTNQGPKNHLQSCAAGVPRLQKHFKLAMASRRAAMSFCRTKYLLCPNLVFLAFVLYGICPYPNHKTTDTIAALTDCSKLDNYNSLYYNLPNSYTNQHTQSSFVRAVVKARKFCRPFSDLVTGSKSTKALIISYILFLTKLSPAHNHPITYLPV